MKKYILFAWGTYEGLGGLNDIKESYDTLEEARNGIKDFPYYNNYQIVDRDTWIVVGDYV